MNQLYVAIGVIVLWAGSGLWLYNHGKAVCRSELSAAVIEEKQAENEAIRVVQQETKQLELVYRDRLRVVQESSDACLDRRLPQSLLDQLQHDLPPE